MSDWTIYYNSKCGSCRKALALLEERKIKPRVVEYLKNPPTTAELDSLLKKLNIEPAGLVRTKEPIYAELKLAAKKLSRQQWLETIVKNPILIERPVVVKDSRAVIARPPEKVGELFD